MNSNSPKEEVEELMNALIPFAQEMLAEQGGFAPFGGAITSKGETINISGYDESHENSSQNLVDIIKEGFKAQAESGEYRATSLLFDIKVQIPETHEKTDAIQINLDHIDNYSVEVFLPYVIYENGVVHYGEIFAQIGDSEIFAS